MKPKQEIAVIVAAKESTSLDGIKILEINTSHARHVMGQEKRRVQTNRNRNLKCGEGATVKTNRVIVRVKPVVVEYAGAAIIGKTAACSATMVVKCIGNKYSMVVFPDGSLGKIPKKYLYRINERKPNPGEICKWGVYEERIETEPQPVIKCGDKSGGVNTLPVEYKAASKRTRRNAPPRHGRIEKDI